jgi:hypothetical protein
MKLGEPALGELQVRFRPSPVRTTPAFHDLPMPVPIDFRPRDQNLKVRQRMRAGLSW